MGPEWTDWWKTGHKKSCETVPLTGQNTTTRWKIWSKLVFFTFWRQKQGALEKQIQTSLVSSTGNKKEEKNTVNKSEGHLSISFILEIYIRYKYDFSPH